jgi:adenylosuccinate lyase
LVRKQTLDAEETGESLVDRIKRNPKIWKNLETTINKVYNLSPESFFGNPSLYTGVAALKAKKIADKYEKKMDELSSRLNE